MFGRLITAEMMREQWYVTVEPCFILLLPWPSPSLSTVTFAGAMAVRVAQAESFTRCCSDYRNICNINRGAEHQQSRHNSRDNEVTVSAPDTAAVMFLSQFVDYAQRVSGSSNGERFSGLVHRGSFSCHKIQCGPAISSCD